MPSRAVRYRPVPSRPAMAGPGGFQFAIDRGGTFTDVFARCPSGRVRVLKLLSEDPGYGDAPTEGIRRVLQEVRPLEPPAPPGPPPGTPRDTPRDTRDPPGTNGPPPAQTGPPRDKRDPPRHTRDPPGTHGTPPRPSHGTPLDARDPTGTPGTPPGTPPGHTGRRWDHRDSPLGAPPPGHPGSHWDPWNPPETPGILPGPSLGTPPGPC